MHVDRLRCRGFYRHNNYDVQSVSAYATVAGDPTRWCHLFLCSLLIKSCPAMASHFCTPRAKVYTQLCNDGYLSNHDQSNYSEFEKSQSEEPCLEHKYIRTATAARIRSSRLVVK